MNTQQVQITVEPYPYPASWPIRADAPETLWRWEIRRDGRLTESGTGHDTETDARRFARGVFDGELA